MTPLRREFSNSRDRNFKPPVFHRFRAAAHTEEAKPKNIHVSVS